MKIYHNPRCSKSRQTINILDEKGADYETVLYLDEVPTEAELTDLVAKLGITPADLVRKGEADYKEKYKGRELTDSEWIAAMVEHPKLIERPIVVKGNKAVLGRPPENVLELL